MDTHRLNALDKHAAPNMDILGCLNKVKASVYLVNHPDVALAIEPALDLRLSGLDQKDQSDILSVS